ncbi:unnamed protein product, partial [marine sediment metagenome]
AANLIVNDGTFPYSYLWSTGDTIEDIGGLPAGIYCVTVTDANLCSDSVCVTITEPAILTANITGTDVLCNSDCNGAADLTVTGGTTPYDYLWNTGQITEDLSSLCAGGTPVYSYLWSTGQTTEDLSDICEGIYCVTVTDDNLCIATACDTITEPVFPLSATITKTDVLCNGDTTGGIDLTISGGTSPYTYKWSSGQTTEDIDSIGGGEYCVTVTDNNLCTLTECVTITEPAAPLSVNIIATNVSCNGGIDGAANLIVNDGTFPYSYLWSTGDSTDTIFNLSS